MRPRDITVTTDVARGIGGGRTDGQWLGRVPPPPLTLCHALVERLPAHRRVVFYVAMTRRSLGKSSFFPLGAFEALDTWVSSDFRSLNLSAACFGLFVSRIVVNTITISDSVFLVVEDVPVSFG